ncbi:hypothetical protein [Sphingomonas sp. 3-13AW]|uniref:hypothetical protein n=1 Tax=Sphingomonas sp. 3-13AW TaxID=3050450 RepID=UPI003BB4C8ED
MMKTIFRLPQFLLEAVSAPLLNNVALSDPSQILDNGTDVYMKRWYIERSTDDGNVYLHHTLRSDYDPQHHDHPWDNLSIWLKGTGYEEVVTSTGKTEVLERLPGTVVFRTAEQRHRILVEEPTWTLFLTGPKIREWGFLDDGRWIHNQEFFKMRGYS